MQHIYLDVTLSKTIRAQCWVHLDVIIVKINDDDSIVVTRNKLSASQLYEIALVLLAVSRGLAHYDLPTIEA